MICKKILRENNPPIRIQNLMSRVCHRTGAPLLATYYGKSVGGYQSAEILICSHVIEAVTRCMSTVFND